MSDKWPAGWPDKPSEVREHDFEDDIRDAIIALHIKSIRASQPHIISATALDPIELKAGASMDGSVWELVDMKGTCYYYIVDAAIDGNGNAYPEVQLACVCPPQILARVLQERRQADYQ